MSPSDWKAGAMVERRLRFGAGFTSEDRARVVACLEPLDHHLAGWQPSQVDLEVSVKDRDSLQQQVTVNLWLAGWPHLVVQSRLLDLDQALRGARRELTRQIEVERDRQKPHRRSVAGSPRARDADELTGGERPREDGDRTARGDVRP